MHYEWGNMGERRSITYPDGKKVRYGYDNLNRLEMVEKDGREWRKYAYDSFGNRIGTEDYEKGRRTAYTYDALNRLLTEEIWEGEGIADTNGLIADEIKSYEYDLRGNLVAEYQGERLLHGYTYNPMNRLAIQDTGMMRLPGLTLRR